MKNKKEILLDEIEKLMAYGREDNTINPALLEYLELSDLTSIKAKLLKRVDTLSLEDKEWLKQFKMYTKHPT